MRSTPLLVLCLSAMLAACDEKPTPETAVSSTAGANDAPSPPSTPTPPPAPAPSEQPTAAAPKVKRTVEDCPKGPNVEFAQKDLETEIRRKLPKPDGPITTADLRKLRSLNLSQVKLAELDVCLFTPMKGLKELFLGPGEYEDLSPIAGATQLESLRASINQVKDLTPLTKLTKLDRLDLGRTQVADLTPLASLTKLTELQIDDTPVQDVSPLAGLVALETLSLKRTRVKDVSALKNLKKLKFLYIGGSPLDEDVMSVAPVRANGTKIVSD